MSDRKLQTYRTTPPKDSGYTFVDEQWKSHTVTPQRPFFRGKDGHLRPTRRAPILMDIPDIWPWTMARKTAEEDMELWSSSASVEDYEAKKQQHAEAKLQEASNQPTFHPFPRLPIELRWNIWHLAMEEPTKITVTCSGYFPPVHGSGWCGTDTWNPRIYATTAFLPPLMLVNRESCTLAAKHYWRVFRGVKGGGGVLAAYPSILTVEISALSLLRLDDMDVVQGFVLVTPSASERIPSRRLQQILGSQNLSKMEIQLGQPARKSQISIVQGRIESAFSKLRADNPNRVAPEIRVVLARQGEPAEVLYSFEGA